jgi:hypothetical protein
MLPGSEPPCGIPFSACSLAHIWPVEMGRQAEEIATELRLPEGFFSEPRNFLVLPRPVHVAFDNEAVLFVPSRDGTITVRKWREDKLTAEDAEKLAPYYNQVFCWPKLNEAHPCVPFMRLLAWRMMIASHFLPAAALSAASATPNNVHTYRGERAFWRLRGKSSL